MIKRIFRLVWNMLKLKRYNKKKGTYIESRYANLNAAYGTGVRIGKGTYIDKETSIGDYSYVNKNSSLERCDIGKYCSISSGVYINPYEHDYRKVTTHPVIRRGKHEKPREKVVIGNDVLISLNVVITEGVHVGDGAVIGAGAVVTKDVRPYEIVGGVPAKHIKWRFESDVIEHLQRVAWWNWGRNKVLEELDLLDVDRGNESEKMDYF